MFRVIPFALAVALIAAPATAQTADPNWPDRPIRFVLPFPAGSSTDTVTRIVQQRLSTKLGQQIVIDNRSGASGNIGSDIIAKATPDGYTWGLATNSTHGIASNVNPTLPYDPVKDFAFASMVGIQTYVLITAPELPVNNVADLIALAKAKPGAINYASAGPASLAYLAGALFAQMAGIKLTHVPYRSSAQSVLDTSEGRIEMQIATLGPVMPFIKSNKVKALAVTGLKRSDLLPDVPTLDELGLTGYEADMWAAFVAPAGTPATYVDKMNAAMREVLTEPKTIEAMRIQGFVAAPTTSAALRERVVAEIEKWRKVIADSGMATTEAPAR